MNFTPFEIGLVLCGIMLIIANEHSRAIPEVSAFPLSGSHPLFPMYLQELLVSI